MCKHNVMEIILKHNYVDNIRPNKLLYCHLIINSAFGAGIHNCIYKILTVSELSMILQKNMHNMQKIIHNIITYQAPTTTYNQTCTALYEHIYIYIYKIQYYEYNNNTEINHNITFILIKQVSDMIHKLPYYK